MLKMLAKCLGCLLLLGLTRCASPLLNKQAEWEARNKLLQRQLADQEKEVSRLQKFLSEEEKEEQDPEDKLALHAEPNVPLTALRPHAEKKEGEEADEVTIAGGRTVATSAFESMSWYHQGMRLLDEKQYDAAVRAFETFLQSEPEHVYADRAQYWIGEAYYRAREYGLALVADNRLLGEYPLSVRVPETMYRAALSHLAMGQKRAARELLRDLLRQFPTESVSTPASKKLAEISVTGRG